MYDSQSGLTPVGAVASKSAGRLLGAPSSTYNGYLKVHERSDARVRVAVGQEIIRGPAGGDPVAFSVLAEAPAESSRLDMNWLIRRYI